MERRGSQIDLTQCLITHLHTDRIGGRIQFRLDRESVARCRAADQIHNHFVTNQRFSSPIEADVREHAVFNLVPGGKWQTRIMSPVSLAKACKASFQSLTR